MPLHDNGNGSPPAGGASTAEEYNPQTKSAKTRISVENLPSKSEVSVSVDTNDAGEYLPLVYTVYVLICQKVA
jgi:hypothetical protein